MANRWGPLAAVADDAKPQRPSKKQPAASANASDGAGVPPAPINSAAAAAFPSPSSRAPSSADFPTLPGAIAHHPAPLALARPQTSGDGGAAAQPKATPAAQPKPAPKDTNWGYLSSDRQKDKVHRASTTLYYGADVFAQARSTGAPVKSASEELERLNKEA